MKRLVWLGLLSAMLGVVATAAPVGKATAEFDNARPEKAETPWGRLVADALRAGGHADIAVVNAGALAHGTLQAGPIDAAAVAGLLKFGDDEVVTIKVSGTQLRQALERAAEVYPAGSPDYLQCSGFTAVFDAHGQPKSRLGSVRYQGREVGAGDSFTTAMPVSLANGTGGYFRIWNSQGAQHSGATMQAAVLSLIKAQGQVSPENAARFGPQ